MEGDESPLLLFAPARVRKPVRADGFRRESHVEVAAAPYPEKQTGADCREGKRDPPQHAHSAGSAHSKNDSPPNSRQTAERERMLPDA